MKSEGRREKMRGEEKRIGHKDGRGDDRERRGW